MHELNEHSQTKNTEDNRRHSSEVRDVHFNQVRKAVLWRELFQIDRGCNANRQRQEQHDQHHKERPDDRGTDARAARVVHARVGTSDKVPVERTHDDVRFRQRIHQIKIAQHQKAAVLQCVARHATLEIPIYARRS